MNLREYIEQIGEVAAANLFQVKRSRVKSWRFGTRPVMPADAKKIVEVTGGKLSLEDVYTEDPRNAKAK